MAHRASPAFVDLSALLSSVSDEALLADSALRALMVDYSCYQLHLADWHARQPPRRHGEFKDWIIEGRTLFDGLDELKQIAHSHLRRD
ncbi:hypothetical protein [Mycobacterium sp. Aquia_213]|uniref:hypothetical protein n=1 Tax=Mycobacterium sp. Aquia_213 TaxID=2991728 RepID=UPI00226E2BF3|nr:hypothetical protein [Mycobacterium sp. Aquia_213]WAC93831.1 hypothetical protein LMQ14_12315 [Mycobacterium sp. Aquia_213]